MRRLGPAALVALALALPAAAGTVRVGDPVPDITLPDWRGMPQSLRALRGQVVAVDFWASWCTLCRAALPALDALGRRHAAAGLRVVAINIDRRRDAADGFLARYLREPATILLHDPAGTSLACFGASGMPALFVVDREGVVRIVEAGYEPSRLGEIEERIRALLAPPGSGQGGPLQ